MEPIHHLMKQIPERRMALSFALRQALEILQMPHQELATWLQEEIEKNPLLEMGESFGFKEGFEVADTPSLYEHLKVQVQETFLEPAERSIAEELIGHIDEKGFFSTPLEEIGTLFHCSAERIESILLKIQSFDPPGIGARNLRESLLIQLAWQGAKKTVAYRLVTQFFDDLLHGRYTALKKKIGVSASELSDAIQKLARLQLRPAADFKAPLAPTAIPDLRALKVDQQWVIEVAEEEFPPIQLRNDFQTLLPKLAQEEKKSVKNWLVSAKWLRRSLNRRKNLLQTLASHLLNKQSLYLERKGPLAEITTQDLALLAGVHESTIHRTLSGKIIEGPWGSIPLRSLLSQPAATDDCKKTLQRLIEQENKKKPLTDEELVLFLQKKGICLARRTVAKYRRELNLGSAAQRKYLS